MPEYCIKRQPENRLGIASAVRNAFKPLADNQMRRHHQRVNRGGKRRKHDRSGFGGGVRFARAFVGNIDRGIHFFHTGYAVIRIGLGGVITPRIGEIKPCPLVGRYDTDAILNVLLKVLQVGCHFRSNARIFRFSRQKCPNLPVITNG